MIIGNIVLEIQRKTLRTKETYFGLEKTVNIAEQIPAGESTGIDVRVSYGANSMQRNCKPKMPFLTMILNLVYLT